MRQCFMQLALCVICAHGSATAQRIASRLASDSPNQSQHQNDHKKKAEKTARAIPPIDAVRPCRQRAKQQQKQDHDQNRAHGISLNMRKENRFPGETFPGLGGWQTSVKTSLTTGPAAVLHARMKLKLKRKLRCSFCGRDESAVAKLLGGPRAYICDACIGVCNRILDATPEASGDWDLM